MSAVEELCRSYLDARWHFDPAAATLAGAAGHDARLGRFDDVAVRELLAALRSLAFAAEELEVDDPQEEIDRTALLDEIRVATFRFQHELPHRRDPAFWVRHLVDAVQPLADHAEPDADAAAALLARAGEVPRFLEAAAATLHEPPRVLVDAALARLGGAAQLLVGAMQRLGPAAPDTRPALEAAVREALGALKTFGEALGTRLAPSADPHAFAAGEAQFERRLHHEHALLAGAPELWRYGLHLRDETEAELAATARRLEPGRPWRDLVEELRAQGAPEAAAGEAAGALVTTLPGARFHAPLDEAARARLPLVRRVVGTPLTAQGWTLYATEPAPDADPEARLLWLARLLHAAVRADLDIGLHTRGTTPEEAVAELQRRVPVTRRDAEAEVTALCQGPTYGLAAAVGRRELVALAQGYQDREGGSASPRAFAEAVLGYGALPPSLIRWGMGLDG